MSPSSNYAGADILQGLNVIPGEDIHQFLHLEEEEDLNVFRNQKFFDFDTGASADFTYVPPKPDAVSGVPAGADSTSVVMPHLATTASPVDFDPSIFPNLGFGDFQAAFPAPSAAFPENVHQNLPNIQPNPAQAYTAPAPASSPDQSTPQRSNSNPKAVPLTRPLADEDASQRAIEDDKRRRNTAASARFRVKKKQREQALEQKAKDLEDQMVTFRNRIQELETENKWLKSLVLEKNEHKPDVVSVIKSLQKNTDSAQEGTKEEPKP